MKLEINQLKKTYGTNQALKKIDLLIPEAQAIALIGSSGSGKSTLLRILAGLEHPSKGNVFFDDNPLVFDEKALLAHRLKLGILFQSWNLFPHLTALENIVLPLCQVRGYPKEAAETYGLELLTRFSMQQHAHKKPRQLSGGQSQRVAIIRAIATKPQLLLFDEPTSALDPLMTSEVLDLIVDQKNEGHHLIIATHHLSFAKKICDWTVFMSEGKVVESNATQAVFDTPRSAEVKLYLDKILKY